METLYLLLPLSLLFVLAIGVAFWWAVSSGQFENSDEAARSILLDDDSTVAPQEPVDASGAPDLLQRKQESDSKK
ncbi:cbb3-type cytochrome oxidase assembly protein CcoS [Pusillimonas sp. CC-YST705]|uniref:Cbb3-type cytochrome oxidase assembly protein CcoS n=1 Tax=Mesopusillimonas faecipullorum TaxID=2755040 RepID=A0ABS8CB94_9BURK|nr:cbb3-type cytochrome oxidase assembly protein CcoS [Mesopusillimonas faecipullorum]MCB5363292.1 cbb3-type cytochrome oxidase assembly protein CcoS [Mesopusillimonas faecipullorum]